MAKQSSFGNMLVVLTVITVITGALLGYVNNITAEPIAQSKKQKQEKAVKDVAPEFDNSPIDEQYCNGKRSRTESFSRQERG